MQIASFSRARNQKNRKVTLSTLCIPYSRKYWRELNLAVGPKIAIAKILCAGVMSTRIHV